jgi:hypothetical protein
MYAGDQAGSSEKLGISDEVKVVKSSAAILPILRSGDRSNIGDVSGGGIISRNYFQRMPKDWTLTTDSMNA